MELSSDQTLQQLMFSLIGIWKASGKTQQDFCKEKDLEYNKFQYWFRKYKRVSMPARSQPDSFISVKVKEVVPSPHGAMELVFPDGRKLIFHQPVEASFMRSLLA